MPSLSNDMCIRGSAVFKLDARRGAQCVAVLLSCLPDVLVYHRWNQLLQPIGPVRQPEPAVACTILLRWHVSLQLDQGFCTEWVSGN